VGEEMRKRRNKAFVDEMAILLKKRFPHAEKPGPDVDLPIPSINEKPSPLLQELQRFDDQVDDAIKAWVPTAD
jgi:hypothetical protein